MFKNLARWKNKIEERQLDLDKEHDKKLDLVDFKIYKV